MTITFGAICNLLQSVENISLSQTRQQGKEKEECIQQIIFNWFKNQRAALDDPSTNGGALLSVLFPHRRKDRVYGLQTPSLAKKLTRVLTFSHGQRMLFDGWRTKAHGDLGVYLERTIKPWDGTFGSKREIPLARVDRLLRNLAASCRFSDASIRNQRSPQFQSDKGLREILIQLDSWEAKWLVRMILRNHCSIELDENYVLRQYHFLLPDLLLFQNDFDAALGMLRSDLSCYPSVPDPQDEESMRREAARRLKPVIGVKVGCPKFFKAWSLENCFKLTGQGAWAADVKYDGEYCEIHVDLEKKREQIKVFSKNGKDATSDRKALLPNIRHALKIEDSDRSFQSKCIVLGEMVVYSDKKGAILPFSKIRKHVARSNSFIGTLQDSLPHEWEHLMVVFFDVLLVDNDPILRHGLQKRRNVLRDLIRVIPGRSMRSEWTLLDFKTGDGITDLKQVFARNLANRQEGLVLKPLHAPYFRLLSENARQQASFFIKLKKDYLGDMGGERDLGDFAIVGASFDAQFANKSNLKPLHWTHFYLGCCTNRNKVLRTGSKPRFKVVACLGLDHCIPKSYLKYLNVHGYLRQVPLGRNGSIDECEIEQSRDSARRLTVAFKKPFIAEILGGGFEQIQNEAFEMLRHPRIVKLHHDRTWEDAVTMEDLAVMAAQKWEIPDSDKLDGHARDVALLVKKYTKGMNDSQSTATTIVQSSQASSSQKSTQPFTTPRRQHETTPDITPIQETPQQHTFTSVTTTPSSSSPCLDYSSTQGKGTRASRELRILVREDTSERLKRFSLPTPASSAPELLPPSSAPSSSAPFPSLRNHGEAKKRSFSDLISPPKMKRRRILTPLSVANQRNQASGSGDSESQG